MVPALTLGSLLGISLSLKKTFLWLCALCRDWEGTVGWELGKSIFLNNKDARKKLKTIGAYIERTDLNFKIIKKLFISWHCPFNTFSLHRDWEGAVGWEPGAAAAESQAGGEDHQGAEAAHQREESHPIRVLHRLPGNSDPLLVPCYSFL